MKPAKEILMATAVVTLLATTAFAQDDGTTSSTEPLQATDEMATTGATDRTILPTPAMTYGGYSTVVIGDISTDTLEGADVYGSDDKNLGNVEALLLGPDGTTVEHIVFDIGGFLGMGVHKVALTPGEVQILRNNNGDEIRVYINATKAQLEEKPEYEG